MKKFTLEIELGNDAMRTTDDIATALREIATNIDKEPPQNPIKRFAGSHPILDVNGNSVGSFGVK